jgi:hypothetical protein
MPSIKLSKQTVDALKPRDQAFVVYDSELSGFGIRVMPSGTRTYVVEYRPGPGGRGVRSVRLALGRHGMLTPDEARKLARDKLADARRGDDPAAARRAHRRSAAFADVVERYMSEVVIPKRAAGTASLYRLYFDKHILPAWPSRRLNAITKADVDRLHRELGADRPATANRLTVTLSGLFSYAVREGLAPDGFNPAKGVQRFKEQGRERFLSAQELSRLGASLRLAESSGLPWEPDADNPKAKHAPKNRQKIYGLEVIAAFRLLLFTGCRLRESCFVRPASSILNFLRRTSGSHESAPALSRMAGVTTRRMTSGKVLTQPCERSSSMRGIPRALRTRNRQQLFRAA